MQAFANELDFGPEIKVRYFKKYTLHVHRVISAMFRVGLQEIEHICKDSLRIEVTEVILLTLSQETLRGMTKVSAIRIVCH